MKKIVCTHNGEGHLDDWFAVAAFLLANPDYHLIRTRDRGTLLSADALIDVGGKYEPEKKRFDHHQHGGAGARTNGIPYASAGLVWKEYGTFLCGGDSELAEKIDCQLISYIDSMDTHTEIYEMKVKNIKVYSVRDYFYSMFRPLRAERGNMAEHDRLFNKALKAATELLLIEIAKNKESKDLVQLVKDCYESSDDKRIIYVPKSSPFETVLPNFPEPVFVILPYQEIKFVVIAIKEKDSSVNRLQFPSEWRAKSGSELINVTGIPNLEFCHSAGFMVTTHTLESARNVAEKAIEFFNV